MKDNSKLRKFTSKFLKVDIDKLPENQVVLKRALISNAIRFAISKEKNTNNGWPRIHINKLRHWVERKLNAIIHAFGNDSEEDWFLNILQESKGPNLIFLGDIIKLTKGYYTISSTRIVKNKDESPILISGLPTPYFANTPIDVKPLGIARAVKNTKPKSLDKMNIPIIPKEKYVGIDKKQSFNEGYLMKFIDNHPLEPWSPRKDWVGYKGRSFSSIFEWGNDPQTVEIQGKKISFWKQENEYGVDKFWLKVIKNNQKEKMVQIPLQLYKQICLIIDKASRKKRVVKFRKNITDGKVQISCTFSPPSAQYRWIFAIGGRYKGFHSGKFQFEIPSNYSDSTKQIFNKLPIVID